MVLPQNFTSLAEFLLWEQPLNLDELLSSRSEHVLDQQISLPFIIMIRIVCLDGSSVMRK